MSLVTLPTVAVAQSGTQSDIHIFLWVHGIGHRNELPNSDSISDNFSRVNQGQALYMAAIKLK